MNWSGIDVDMNETSVIKQPSRRYERVNNGCLLSSSVVHPAEL
jgi:hypothetical protein